MRPALRSLVPGLALAAALAGPAMASPPGDLNLASAVGPIEPVQAISFPDLRLVGGEPAPDAGLGVDVAELNSPCRDYADQPSSQPDAGFAECWNEKKTAWDRTKPSAIGPSLPQMNSPLDPGQIKSGAPRETPVP